MTTATSPGSARPSSGEKTTLQARLWIAFPVILLGITLIVGVLTWFIANTDPSFAVEPDAYRKGLAWDQSVAQSRENERLGWKWAWVAPPGLAADGSLALRLTLRDAAGQVLPDAKVDVEAIPVARANDRVKQTLKGQGEGRFEGQVPQGRSGLWEFRFEAQSGGARFTWTDKRELGRLPSGGSAEGTPAGAGEPAGAVP